MSQEIGRTSVETVAEETTADGSLTLYRADIDEHYGSVRGAVAESRHVYVESCLRHAEMLRPESDGPLRVLEVGFGTGLNAAMSVGAVARQVEYISLELYPLSKDVASRLGYDRFAPVWNRVIDAPWNMAVEISNGFVIEKRETDFLKTELPRDIDAVYYDAFAPVKQPELWTSYCFHRVFEAMRPGGVLTTYCAKGAVRRMLGSVGFAVERLAGPEGGKREILRATKPKTEDGYK